MAVVQGIAPGGTPRAVQAAAEGGMHIVDGDLGEPLGEERMATMTTARGLDNIPSGARIAWVQAQEQPVRVRLMATKTPTATNGKRLVPESDGFWITSPLESVKVIEEVSGAILDVTYFA